MKKILIAAGCIFCWTLCAMADDVKIVENLLREKTDQVLTILKQKDIKEPAKKNRIMEIINPIIDFELMARLTLGKANWGKLNQQQQKEFVELFVERLKRSYLDKSTFYDDEKFTYKPGFLSGNKVHVPVEIVSNEKPIELLYKFYRSGAQGWKAYDVEINGVSLIRSYQSQFSEVLRTGTPQDLLNELKKTVVK